jgi:hypothetical protein
VQPPDQQHLVVRRTFGGRLAGGDVSTVNGVVADLAQPVYRREFNGILIESFTDSVVLSSSVWLCCASNSSRMDFTSSSIKRSLSIAESFNASAAISSKVIV